MTVDIVVDGTTSALLVEGGDGVAAVGYAIVLGALEDTDIVDDLPSTLTVFVQGAGSLEVVTFSIDGDDVWTATADAFGDVGPIDIPLGEDLTESSHTLTATSPSNGIQDLAFVILTALVGGTADPGVDAPPVLVADSAGRWVLQDLLLDGLGSWVMPINPKSMSNPHVSKVVQTGHTTSVATGRYQLGESNLGVVQWTISGYCPDQVFHEHLEAYAELARRIYVIDHRGRAWKVAVQALEITPRKRQLNEDGTPQDWASDYRMVFDVLDQAFLTPS